MGAENSSRSSFSQKARTTESLAAVGSLATGLFCLERLPTFTTGPECLLREGSAEDQPIGLPSSPPAMNDNRLLNIINQILEKGYMLENYI
jgi:hypothetical protein